MSTAAIVLAAGASRRMGRNKLLLPVDGEPLVRRTVRRALEAGLAPVVVVLGHESEAARAALAGLPVRVATSPDPTGPTSASLHAGLDALAGGDGAHPEPSTDAVVVLLADMPHVTTAMLSALRSAAQADAAPLHVSRYGDVHAPPLLFRRALWSELRAWHGEGCGKAVVRAHLAEATLHDWPAAALQDVDTPADYAALTAR